MPPHWLILLQYVTLDYFLTWACRLTLHMHTYIHSYYFVSSCPSIDTDASRMQHWNRQIIINSSIDSTSDPLSFRLVWNKCKMNSLAVNIYKKNMCFNFRVVTWIPIFSGIKLLDAWPYSITSSSYSGRAISIHQFEVLQVVTSTCCQWSSQTLQFESIPMIGTYKGITEKVALIKFNTTQITVGLKKKGG